MGNIEQSIGASVNEFKVNKWMHKMGWRWVVSPGTPESPNAFNGTWHPNLPNTAINQGVTQEMAKLWYESYTTNRLSQRLLSALRLHR